MDIAFAQAVAPNSTSAAAEGSTDVIGMVVKYGTKFLIVLVILLVAYVIAFFIGRKFQKHIEQNQDNAERMEWIMTAKRLVYVVLILVGLAIGLSVTNLVGKIGWLYGSIGLGIGYSLKNVIGNFIAGIILLIQKKVRIGDRVNVEGVFGIVTNIGSRAITIHEIGGGTDVVMPNLEFFNQYVRVVTAYPYRRLQVNVGVGYDTDFAKANQIILETLRKDPDVMQEPLPDVLFDTVEDSKINLIVRWWIKSDAGWWIISSNVLREVFTALRSNGIDISFPVKTLRVDKHQSGKLYDRLQTSAGAKSPLAP